MSDTRSFERNGSGIVLTLNVLDGGLCVFTISGTMLKSMPVVSDSHLVASMSNVCRDCTGICVP